MESYTPESFIPPLYDNNGDSYLSDQRDSSPEYKEIKSVSLRTAGGIEKPVSP